MVLAPGAGREIGDKLMGKQLARYNVVSVSQVLPGGSCEPPGAAEAVQDGKPVTLSFMALCFASFSYFPFSLQQNFVSHLPH